MKKQASSGENIWLKVKFRKLEEENNFQGLQKGGTTKYTEDTEDTEDYSIKDVTRVASNMKCIVSLRRGS